MTTMAGTRVKSREGISGAIVSLIDRWPVHLSLLLISLFWLVLAVVTFVFLLVGYGTGFWS